MNPGPDAQPPMLAQATALNRNRWRAGRPARHRQQSLTGVSAA